MCQHLTLLVQHDERRYIAQCEHGTIHLIWRRSALQFHPSEFLRIARALECWSTSDDPHIIDDSCVRLFQQPSGWIQVWLCGVGLNCAPLDVHTLIVMLCTAALQLDRTQAQARAPAPQFATYQPIQVTPNRTWSNN